MAAKVNHLNAVVTLHISVVWPEPVHIHTTKLQKSVHVSLYTADTVLQF